MVAHSGALGVEVAYPAAMVHHPEVVLPADRRIHVHKVGEHGHRIVQCGLGLPDLCLRGFDLRRQLLGAGQQGGAFVRAGLRHLPAEVLLLGAHLLEGRERGPVGAVGGHRGVHQFRRLAAPGLGDADTVGVGAQHLQIDHGIEGIAVAYR